MTIRSSQQRADKDWIAELSASDERQATALEDLRAVLVAGLLRALGNRSGLSTSLVEDFAQDALLRITDRLHSFRGESRFLTWALAVAVRVAVSELRRARWRDVSLDEMAEAGRVIPGPLGEIPVEHRMAAEQLAAIVAQLVETELTAKQRQALSAELSGAPIDEIARRMGSNRNALYKLLHDARLRLKQAILRSGWSEEDVLAILRDRS